MEELEKAAQAIAAGNHREAHLLLARVIKSHPDNVDAWLMLSQTTASPEQQKTFLKRALLIDPNHPTAQARLAALEGEPTEVVSPPAAVPTPEPEAAPEVAPPIHSPAGEEEATVPWNPLPVSDNLLDYEVQAQGETVPPWMAGEGEFIGSDAAPAMSSDNVPTIPDAPVPDWLRSDLEETWLEQSEREEQRPEVWKSEEIAATPTTPIEESNKKAAATAKPARSQQRAATAGSSRTGLLEWALALLFILLFLAVVYVALSVV